MNKNEPEIVVTFDEDKVLVETIGFEGTDCIKATADLLKALGTKELKRTLKPEYHKGPATKLKNERIKI